MSLQVCTVFVENYDNDPFVCILKLFVLRTDKVKAEDE